MDDGDDKDGVANIAVGPASGTATKRGIEAV